jgi:ethanolamine permease
MVDFERWVDAHNRTRYESTDALMHVVPATWLYIGVEYLSLAISSCAEPKTMLPKAYIGCILTLIVTAIAVTVIVCSQYPGIEVISSELLPLTHGYARMFGISESGAVWLNVLPVFASIFGFIWGYGKQLASISASGMLRYLIFKTKFTSVARAFNSPLGVVGGLYGLCVQLVSIAGLVGFRAVDQVALIVMVVLYIASTIFYFGYLAGKQKFSEEEKKEMFKAYLINGK